MFNFLKAASDYLDALTLNGQTYVNAGKLKTSVSTINDGISKSMKIPHMIEEYDLNYVIMSRGKNPQVLTNVDMKAYKANPRKYALYICFESMKSANAISAILQRKYPDCFEEQPVMIATLNEESKEEIDYEEEKASIESPVKLLYRGADLCPVIDLEDHERFTDGDRVFDIEVRGEREPTKILFKVKDIAQVFGMPTLAKDMLAKEIYQEGVHYVVLIYSPCATLEEKHMHYKNRRAFFTIDGLLRLCTSSNSKAYRMMPWIIQGLCSFWQIANRTNPASILQDYHSRSSRFSGIYLIRIGKVKALRTSMKVSRDQYPPNEFDSAHIYKYGRSNNIARRYGEHIADRLYGQYGNDLKIELVAFTPAAETISAENTISGYVRDRNLTFEFTDNAGKCHDELIIIKRDELAGVREEYIKMIHKYPSSENEFALHVDSIRSGYLKTIAELEHRCEILTKDAFLTNALHSKDDQLKDANHKSALLLKDDQLKDANHKSALLLKDMEIMNMKMKMAGLE